MSCSDIVVDNIADILEENKRYIKQTKLRRLHGIIVKFECQEPLNITHIFYPDISQHL